MRRSRITAAFVIAATVLTAEGMRLGQAGVGATWQPEPPSGGMSSPPAPVLPETTVYIGSSQLTQTTYADSMASIPDTGQLVELTQAEDCVVLFDPEGRRCEITDTLYAAGPTGTWTEVQQWNSYAMSCDMFGVCSTTSGYPDFGAAIVWYDPLKSLLLLDPCATGTCVSSWAGAKWLKRAVSGPSPHLTSPFMPGAVYDATAHSIVYFTPSSSTATQVWRLSSGLLGALSWSQGPVIPAQLTGQAAASVPSLGGLAVFDGASSTTWRLAGSTLAQLSLGAAPSPRATGTYAMAWDSLHRAAVLFGGRDPATLRDLTDTWQFDGTAWHQVATARSAPSAGPMAELAAAGGLVMLSAPASTTSKLFPTSTGCDFGGDPVCKAGTDWIYVTD